MKFNKRTKYALIAAGAYPIIFIILVTLSAILPSKISFIITRLEGIILLPVYLLTTQTIDKIIPLAIINSADTFISFFLGIGLMYSAVIGFIIGFTVRIIKEKLKQHLK